MLQFIILFLFIKITLYSCLVLRMIKLSQNNIGIQKESLAPLVLMGQSLIIKFQSIFRALRLHRTRFHSTRQVKPSACCSLKNIPEISTSLITILNKKSFKYFVKNQKFCIWRYLKKENCVIWVQFSSKFLSVSKMKEINFI